MRPLLLSILVSTAIAEPIQLSGIYPHLAMFNDEGECGTGAVVPWADHLWVVTYAPHWPTGSSDKLYEITPDLKQIIRPESIGGTPANRMIHRESQQLFIGPHAIRSNGEVRTIPYSRMFGRHTGNARSLTDPAGKILYATMEEGIYEVDVKSLAATELWGDEQSKSSPRKADLPGYHGKGFYSGQGVYVYSNNGEHGKDAQRDPTVPSGVLAEWDGKADAWTIVRRNQFTEVTGPGGIHGNENPATDPIWALGWDFKSLLLGVRDAKSGWSFFRLPKGSHSYDGAHGWNTEWPRIRDIGEDHLLMTMHGTFWKFPKTFTANSSRGILPQSNYLKVIGDFCRWNDKIVFGCDDTAKNEFLNKRKAKGEIAAPQSQSNLWFVDPEQLDHIGPVIGRGAVWMREDLKADEVSDPYLFAVGENRGLHLSHSGKEPWKVIIETGSPGEGWKKHSEQSISRYSFVSFDANTLGAWIRLRSINSTPQACAAFTYRHRGSPSDKDVIFAGLGRPPRLAIGGIVRAREDNKKTLSFAALTVDEKPGGYYELDGEFKLRRVDDPETEAYTRKHAAIPTGSLTIDAASVVFTDDDGKRWRLPKGDPFFDAPRFGGARIAREVATERDLLNAHGTFYELPANNAGGISKLRPVSTHNRLIHDFCSYRGLLVMSGIVYASPAATAANPHIIRSDDGKAALWAGAIDDIWKLGKPRGTGGPWHQTKVKAKQVSDPYLLTGYDKKSLQLRFDDPQNDNLHVTAQIDIHGDGTWVDYKTFLLENGETIGHEFPEAFSAYWIRFTSDEDTTATATLFYE
jgi:hypothetical protein